MLCDNSCGTCWRQPVRKRLHTLKTCKQCGLRCTHKNESTETAKRARSVGSTTSLSAKCHVLKLLSWLSQKRQPGQRHCIHSNSEWERSEGVCACSGIVQCTRLALTFENPIVLLPFKEPSTCSHELTQSAPNSVTQHQSPSFSAKQRQSAWVSAKQRHPASVSTSPVNQSINLFLSVCLCLCLCHCLCLCLSFRLGVCLSISSSTFMSAKTRSGV